MPRSAEPAKTDGQVLPIVAAIQPPPIQQPIAQLPSEGFQGTPPAYFAPLTPSQEELKRSLNQIAHSQFCNISFFQLIKIALSASQENNEQSAFMCPGISRMDNINKLFIDSQPMLLRGDSFGGNEEIGSFPLLASAHQSFKAIIEVEPVTKQDGDTKSHSIFRKEETKDSEAK